MDVTDIAMKAAGVCNLLGKQASFFGESDQKNC